MNPHNNHDHQDPSHQVAPHQPIAQQPVSRQQAPMVESTRPDPTDPAAAGVPDAIQAADVERRGQMDASQVRARGVDWVRSSDLLARGSAKASWLAIDFEAHLAQKVRDPLARGAKHVGAKAGELPSLSAFGRRGGRENAQRGPVGMS